MKVLFVCEGNMMRSQMAEAFYNKLTSTNEAISAGAIAETKEHISKRSIEAMMDYDIDMSTAKPKQVTPEMLDTIDRIVLFPTSFMPDYVKNNSKAEMWDVVDPHYHHKEGMELVRRVRDEIKSRVERLIETQKGT